MVWWRGSWKADDATANKAVAVINILLDDDGMLCWLVRKGFALGWTDYLCFMVPNSEHHGKTSRRDGRKVEVQVAPSGGCSLRDVTARSRFTDDMLHTQRRVLKTFEFWQILKQEHTMVSRYVGTTTTPWRTQEEAGHSWLRGLISSPSCRLPPR